MIKTTNIKNQIKIKELNFKSPYTFPTYQTTGDNSFMLGLIAGVRNAGKSTLVLNIIETEKKHLLQGDAKVYFVSPTKDAKIEYFIDKYPKNFVYVDELTVPSMKKILGEIEQRVVEWKNQYEAYEILSRYLKNPNSCSPEELFYLQEMNFFQNDDFGKFDVEHPCLSTLVIDDSVGCPMICEGRSKDGRWFQKFVLRHRHYPYYCNVFVLSQYIKAVAKYYRTNCSWVMLFPFRDFNCLKAVFDEYSILFKNNINNFLNLIEDIRKRDDHSFVNIYYDKIQYVRIGFNEECDFTATPQCAVEKPACVPKAPKKKKHILTEPSCGGGTPA